MALCCHYPLSSGPCWCHCRHLGASCPQLFPSVCKPGRLWRASRCASHVAPFPLIPPKHPRHTPHPGNPLHIPKPLCGVPGSRPPLFVPQPWLVAEGKSLGLPWERSLGRRWLRWLPRGPRQQVFLWPGVWQCLGHAAPWLSCCRLGLQDAVCIF